MAGDDLNDPLGLELNRQAAPVADRPWGAMAVGGLGLIAVALGAFTLITGNPMGGEPFAIATIQPAKKLEPVTPNMPVGSAETTATIPPKLSSTAAEIEEQSGVKITRQGGGGAPGALIIQVPQTLGVQLNPAPDRRLVEKTKFGLLPRVGSDGAKPLDVYARPVMLATSLKPDAPRIAILVGGMGLNQITTDAAISALPGEITLGFAPFGQELERQTSRARAQGHEIVLQLPMEPFDYPQNDPGPHTLLSADDPAKIRDDLHWLMGRFVGYAGVTNFLGAKFTANEAALSPVLRELANRGLFYLEDGSSNQSLSSTLAPAAGLRSQKADLVLDASSRPEAIDAALAKLEALARAQGSAVGVASGLPGSIERIARFAKTLENRGIALVPLSAAMKRGQTPVAQHNR